MFINKKKKRQKKDVWVLRHVWVLVSVFDWHHSWGMRGKQSKLAYKTCADGSKIEKKHQHQPPKQPQWYLQVCLHAV